MPPPHLLDYIIASDWHDSIVLPQCPSDIIGCAWGKERGFLIKILSIVFRELIAPISLRINCHSGTVHNRSGPGLTDSKGAWRTRCRCSCGGWRGRSCGGCIGYSDDIQVSDGHRLDQRLLQKHFPSSKMVNDALYKISLTLIQDRDSHLHAKRARGTAGNRLGR